MQRIAATVELERPGGPLLLLSFRTEKTRVY